MDYSNYFKALRESKGFTLREVEAKTGVSNAYLSQLESGKIKQPSPLYLHKLADLYEVRYSLLMEKVGYPTLEETDEENIPKRQLSHRLGGITDDEELELLEYLKLIRKRQNR